MPTSSSDTRQSLMELTKALRGVHRALVDILKGEYEKEWGPVNEGGQLLQLLTRHPQFDWLHQMSEMMVDIDEMLDEEIVSEDTMRSVFKQTRSLIIPSEPNPSEFSRRYIALLQEHPPLVMAHANLQRILATA